MLLQANLSLVHVLNFQAKPIIISRVYCNYLAWIVALLLLLLLLLIIIIIIIIIIINTFIIINIYIITSWPGELRTA